MKTQDKIKMFKDVFAPKKDEKVLVLVDVPYKHIKDNELWKDRRKMARDWYNAFKEMGDKSGFSVDFLEYNATGQHNSSIPSSVVDIVRKMNLVIAMTEFSATSSLAQVCKKKGSSTRCASMPMVEKRMEETAFKADYSQVKSFAIAIEHMLNDSVGAKVIFSTGDVLFIDLRNRIAESDTGDCSQAGQCINFPSGEGFKAPYEAASDELEAFGESKTKGVLPVFYDKEIVKFIIENNRIVQIVGSSKKAKDMQAFFEEDDTRRNIAELGIGCNPKAVITGNVLEDEKVGLHIAYGMSIHLGGKVDSDVHQDICYSKGCPVEGITVVLTHKDGSKTVLIKDAMLRYDILG